MSADWAAAVTVLVLAIALAAVYAPLGDYMARVEILARRRRTPLRKRELLHEVWGSAYDSETNYLRVHQASIRRKLEADPGHPRIFITETGLDYRMRPG